MKTILSRLAEGRDLTPSQAHQAMYLLASGQASEGQTGAFLAALHLKGETAEEIAAFGQLLRRYAVCINPRVTGPLVDTCGTGGDGKGTFNISTAAALVAAGAGVRVVKHGNRSVSSSCGSADVLEELGVKVDLPPEIVSRMVEEIGIGFLFAPSYHPALKYASTVRRDLGFSTVFNVLGPLVNPADASVRLLGVHNPGMVQTIALTLRILGAERAMVVHGDGLDEITVSGETLVAELRGEEIRSYTVTPEMFGIRRSPQASLRGRFPRENAAIIRDILQDVEGPCRDVVLLNAGAAIYLAGRAGTHEEGISLAERSICTGAAYGKLEALVCHSRGET